MGLVMTLLCLGSWVLERPAVLEKMTAAYKNLDTLEAELIQTSSYPQLGLSDPPEEGLLQIQKRGEGMNVRLEFTLPERRILVIKDGAYTFYQPRIKQAIVGRADDNRSSHASFLKFLLGDVAEVEGEYRVEVIDETVEIAGRKTTHIRLVPKEHVQSFYTRIDLWVDDGLGLPIQEKLVEPNGDEILVQLQEIRVNAPSGHFDFELDLPEGVERIKN